MEEFTMSSRIQIAFPNEEPMPANMLTDFDWVKSNRDNLLEKYGSCIVVVYEQALLGVGDTYLEAIANAEKNLPDNPEIITPVVKGISYTSARLRRLPKKVETKYGAS
jgi:hypothetical protein